MKIVLYFDMYPWTTESSGIYFTQTPTEESRQQA